MVFGEIPRSLKVLRSCHFNGGTQERASDARMCAKTQGMSRRPVRRGPIRNRVTMKHCVRGGSYSYCYANGGVSHRTKASQKGSGSLEFRRQVRKEQGYKIR